MRNCILLFLLITISTSLLAQRVPLYMEILPETKNIEHPDNYKFQIKPVSGKQLGVRM